ncbi:4612_t:CDS:2 [Racocetra fulgida]|uniref:4612_t:CDS:1 n=2 Tax=Racocetra TaxID=940663 RepID=A0A9N8VMH9_9GLOM|nr:4612_t:CDS:2 [Racocetra fulgida]
MFALIQKIKKDIGFNAISGVLNNPNAKVSNKIKPLKNDIPSVHRTAIRKVKPTDFKSYIRQISPVFERYIHNRDNQKPLATSILEANLGNLQSSYDDNEIPAHRLESTRNPYTIPILPQSPDETQSLKPDIELPLLEVVPSIFFDPDFDLENPKTFDIVCEKTEDIENNIDSLSISTNAIIQEKLCLYLDTVEMHLVNEISLRSSSFFTALSNLRMLHSETLECVSQINNLRKKLARVENSQVKRGLEVVRLKRRRENIVKLYKGIRMIAEIRSTQPLIQMLLGQGDYFSAMDFIEKVNTVLRCGKSQQDQLINAIKSFKVPTSVKDDPRAIIIRKLNSITKEIKNFGVLDLEKVKVLTYFSEQLNEMDKMIGITMENDFLNVLFSDFSEHIKNVNAINAINVLHNNSSHLAKNNAISVVISNNLVTEKEERLKNRIGPLILGLCEMNRFESALQTYRERMMEEIKCITQVQKIAIYNEIFSSILTDTSNTDLEINSEESLLENEKDLSNNNLQDDDSNSKESTEIEIPTAATQNEHIESKNFKFKTALKFTTGIKSIIKKTTFFTTKSQASLPEITPKISESTSPNSRTNEILDDNNYTKITSDSSQIIFVATDLAHVWCANLISIRADQNAQLNQKDFYRLFNITWAFVLESESLCGRVCYGLRGTITSQAKAFLNNFHAEKIKQEAASVENEQWAQAEVPIHFQQTVNQIVAAAVKGLSGFRYNPLGCKNENEQIVLNNSDTKQNHIDNIGKYIFVEERQFFMVGCGLILLEILDDYLVTQDVRYYIRKLSALNFQELVNELETVVSNLPIKEKKSEDETVDLTSSSAE